MPLSAPPNVAVIGGGPAGLMAAEILAAGHVAVTVYDQMPSVGRKFLLAGRGGLNLTHSEDLPTFLDRYGQSRERLEPAIAALPPVAVRGWCEALGQPTFAGSSGRVFPVAMKASPLLRAWLRRLDDLGVRFATRHRWLGWNDAGQHRFATPAGETTVQADATVLALGGASWPRLGSDGGWVDTLRGVGIVVAPLQPANCGFCVAWSELFRARFEGEPLKRIALSFGAHRVSGEAVVTVRGIEGGAVYALSAPLRDALVEGSRARLSIDLRPDVPEADLARQLGARAKKQSLSSFLRKAAKLSPVAIGLLQEAAHADGAPLGGLTPDAMAAAIKAVPLWLTAPMPIERAISTAGGIAFEDVDARFMLRRRPGVFVAGEMLDWDAPTGGYLLQACFAAGAAAGHGARVWLAEHVPSEASD